MAGKRVPNPALRNLLREAGWTGETFARAVNACARESGQPMSYDRTSVSHWLAGRRPRQPAADIVAEVLTRRLGRTVTPADAGLAPAVQLAPAPVSLLAADPSEQLAALGSQAARRARHAPAASFDLGALTAAAGTGDYGPPRRPGGAGQPRAGREEVAAAEQMISVLSASEACFGGGHVRAAISGYLAGHLRPMLRATAPPRIRARIQHLAAQASYLAGFACFDDEQHSLAERYFLVALRLAGESGDLRTRAITLRALSVQAHHLRYHRQARDLAEAAVSAASGKLTPADRAFLGSQLAVATAATGDRHGAESALRSARAGLGHAASQAGPVGQFHAQALALAEAKVHSELGERRAAITALRAALAGRPAAERRSRALIQAELGSQYLADGQFQQAIGTWRDLLGTAAGLSSGRVGKAIGSVIAGLRSYPGEPAAASLLAEAIRVRAGNRHR
ncbi:hypothetical protein [Longispora albida]|uniref:hypothetical protein n=1 Tax=Longispora albida TaxID=203523 RepID=UPI000370D874|nr:hypothetical protein [Longispora albida]